MTFSLITLTLFLPALCDVTDCPENQKCFPVCCHSVHFGCNVSGHTAIGCNDTSFCNQQCSDLEDFRSNLTDASVNLHALMQAHVQNLAVPQATMGDPPTFTDEMLQSLVLKNIPDSAAQPQKKSIIEAVFQFGAGMMPLMEDGSCSSATGVEVAKCDVVIQNCTKIFPAHCVSNNTKVCPLASNCTDQTFISLSQAASLFNVSVTEEIVKTVNQTNSIQPVNLSCADIKTLVQNNAVFANLDATAKVVVGSALDALNVCINSPNSNPNSASALSRFGVLLMCAFLGLASV